MERTIYVSTTHESVYELCLKVLGAIYSVYLKNVSDYCLCNNSTKHNLLDKFTSVAHLLKVEFDFDNETYTTLENLVKQGSSYDLEYELSMLVKAFGEMFPDLVEDNHILLDLNIIEDVPLTKLQFLHLGRLFTNKINIYKQ